MAATKIDQVIRQLCRETGEPDYKNYDTILGHVRGALVDLNLFTFPNMKTVEITANNIKNLVWPADCVKPVIIGVKRRNKICNISVDSGVSFAGTSPCGSITEVELDIENTINNECGQCYLYDGGILVGYGFGYDHIKACTNDFENRFTNIKFKILSGDVFQFTYISDGIGAGVSHVPIEAETCIGEWVMWKYFRTTKIGVSNTARENYKQESYRLKKFYNDQSIEAWIKAVIKR